MTAEEARQAFLQPARRDELENVFKPLFKNGPLRSSELKKIFKEYYNDSSRNPHKISKERINKIIKQADINKDKKLQYEELVEIVTNKTYSVLSVEKDFLFRMVFKGFHVKESEKRRKRIEYEANRSCWPPPIFVITIALIEISVFIYYFIKMKFINKPLDYFVPLNSTLIYNPDKKYQIWRFFTYSVLHGGVSHLVSNLLMFLILGITLETVHRSHRVSLIFLAGVLASSLSVSVLDPNSYLVGSSGGVFALFAAHISNIILNHKTMDKGFGLSAKLRLFFLSIIAFLNLVLSANKILKHPTQQQSLFSHLFGCIAGFLVGFAVLKDISGKNRFKTYLVFIGWILFIIMIVIFIEYNLIKAFLID